MRLHLCLVLSIFSLSLLAQPSRFEFPIRPPVADADPTVRYPISVRVPTRLKVERTADMISVSLDTNSFESTNLTVGTNMVTGTLGDLYVYPVGSPRSTNSTALGLGSRGAIATGLDFNLGTIYLHTVPDGIPQPGVSYEVEMDAAAFETDIPGQHFWLPMARGKKFQVLWRRTLKQVVKW